MRGCNPFCLPALAGPSSAAWLGIHPGSAAASLFGSATSRLRAVELANVNVESFLQGQLAHPVIGGWDRGIGRTVVSVACLACLDAIIGRGVRGLFRRVGLARADLVQVDVDAADEDGRLVREPATPKPAFEKSSRATVLAIGAAADMFAEGLHEERDAAQSLPQFDDAGRVGCFQGNFRVRDLADSTSVLAFDEAIDRQLTPYYLFVGPRGDDIGTSSQHQMKVIG